MVSASHNPPGDNGIKVFGPTGYKIDRTLQAAIEAGLRGDEAVTIQATGLSGPRGCGPAHQREDLLENYREALIASVGAPKNTTAAPRLPDVPQ